MGKFVLSGEGVSPDMDVNLLGEMLDKARDMMIFGAYAVTEGEVSAENEDGEIKAKFRLVDGPLEDLIPRDQRHIAALVLAAIDLPAPAHDYATTLMEAAEIMPGCTTGDIPFGASRLEMLVKAQQKLDLLIRLVRAG